MFRLQIRGTGYGATSAAAWPVEPKEYDIDARMAEMDRLGVDVQILSVTPLLFFFGADPTKAVEHARALNDELAAIQHDHPDRFRAIATLPLQDLEESLRELERAVGELGLGGIQIGANVWGKDLDHPTVVPVLERAAELGAVVFVHPAVTQSHPGAVANMERLGDFYLRNVIGNPLDTTIAIARLTFSGVLDRLPDLKIYFAHAGGYAPFALGRMIHGQRVRSDTEISGRTAAGLTGRIYVDTITHDPRALRYVVDTLGPERVMLGSDFPADMGPTDPVSAIDQAELGSETRALVLGGNAARLFGIR